MQIQVTGNKCTLCVMGGGTQAVNGGVEEKDMVE